MYTGYRADVSLKAATSAAISGADADLIIVDFPAEYDIDFVSEELSCDSLNLPSTAGDVCTTAGNRILISGYETATDHST